VADVVIVETTWLPRTASSAEAAGTTSTEVFADMRAQNFASFSGLRDQALMRERGRTAAIASAWPRACQPVPITPATLASARASARVATPAAAPVRTMPRRFASTMPSRLPRSAEKT